MHVIPSPANIVNASQVAWALDANAVMEMLIVPKVSVAGGSKDFVPGSKPDVVIKLFDGSFTKAKTAQTTKIKAKVKRHGENFITKLPETQLNYVRFG